MEDSANPYPQDGISREASSQSDKTCAAILSFVKSVIVGTAGHIDHGKTALIKALTGIDADRLEEEKRRGITIDIGFAHLELPAPNGETMRFGFVDVPGHERFVRNMLAGVGGIDFVLLVIAADEGIKPQTREHFDICRLLSIRRGVTVLTKADAVDAETLEVVRLEVEDFLRGSFLDPKQSPIMSVSSLTGSGLDQLKNALVKVAGEVSVKDATALVRMPIDRVFTMKGFGTVVTGTLISGMVRKEEELEVFPSGKRVRVRGIQVHGASAEHAVAGERTALNLAGVSTEEMARGLSLAPPETFRSVGIVDVSVSVLPSAKPLKDRSRVHFHSYTMESIAEVRLFGDRHIAPGGQMFAQLKLSKPALLLPGDRFILRQFSPVVTTGGGMVLDNAPLLSPAEMRRLERQNKVLVNTFQNLWETFQSPPAAAILQVRVSRRGKRGLSVREAVAETGWRSEKVIEFGVQLVNSGVLVQYRARYFAQEEFRLSQLSLIDGVSQYQKANPLNPGITKGELQSAMQRFFEMVPELFEAGLDRAVKDHKLVLSGELVHLPGRGVSLKDEEAESKATIEQAFASSGLQVPSLKDVIAGLKIDRARAQKIVTLLLRDKILIKISDDLVFHHSALVALRQKVAALKPATQTIDVARFKDLTGVSRKYAIPLLEYLDRERVTKRVGNERAIL